MLPARRYDLLRSRLDRFTRTLPGVETGEIGAVHRIRVESRRLRELIPVLEIEQRVVRKLGRRLRKLTRRLGSVRDLDVLTLLVDELRENRRLPDRALRRVGGAVHKARDEARSRLGLRAVATDLKRVGRKLEAIAAELETAGEERPGSPAWRWAVDARVSRRASSLNTAIEEAGAVYLPERIHRVRLALKKLRYGVELALEMAGIRGHADLATLKRGQDLLGRLRDLQLLIERVRGVQTAMTPPDLPAWRELDMLVTALEHSCRRLHARYVRDRAALTLLCGRLAARSSSGRSLARLVG
jgi:CHAD domain-containing protein